ncbi:putative iron-sulfur cluster assembly accessory protein [Candidatus Zinderia insecticola CARI]|uniref:Putative iron-sulfur cluster assembly accessory protein n=1 Tax=Zinderia insecticola (strain CARI) TaxID=871271 RepID=E0TIR0_ZINIC|nr:putative iron-sulfur cluster assembly accessory protein [Candidatus Zinderia insecticola CARI]
MKFSNKSLKIINNKYYNKFLRIYIKGGGCMGLKYIFNFKRKYKNYDLLIKIKNLIIIIDFISYQYLYKSYLKYKNTFEKSNFIIFNPEVKKTCNCGSSFNF